jgi:hypothetical protein
MTGDECLKCCGVGLGGRKYWLVIGWILDVDLLSFMLKGGCSLCVYSPGRAGDLSERGSSSSSESLIMIVEQLSFSLAHSSLLCENDVMMISLATSRVAILEGLVAYPDSPMLRKIVSHCLIGVEYSSSSLITSLSLSSHFVAKTRLKCLPWSNKSVPMFSWALSWWLDVGRFVRFESVSPAQSAEFGTR